MRNSKILNELELRLKNFDEKIALLQEKLYDEKNILDIGVYSDIQFYRSEIYHTKKKITFVKQGKSFLGSSLSSYDSKGRH